MVASSCITPGMIVCINKNLFRVESSVKVVVPKGASFIKVKLRDMRSEEVMEKNFKVDQQVKDVSLDQRPLEFLYPEGKDYLFLDTKNLEQVLVPVKIVRDQADYLKQGVEILGSFYGESIFSVELPQFLEIMVSELMEEEASNGEVMALLETGAKVEVPSFIEEGDIIKVDTKTNEFIQRV